MFLILHIVVILFRANNVVNAKTETPVSPIFLYLVELCRASLLGNVNLTKIQLMWMKI